MGVLLGPVDDARRHGRNVHNRTAALGQHRPPGGLGAEEDTLQINAQNRVPVGFGDGLGGTASGNPRAVDGWGSEE